MKKTVSFVIFTLVAVFLFFSCSQAQKNFSYAKETYDMYEEAAMYSETKQTNGDSAGPEAQLAVSGRKLIQTANVRVSTAGITELNTRIQAKIGEYGGFTENERQSSTPEQVITYIDMTVKIPAEKFGDFLGWLDSGAKVIEKSLQTQDVTNRYYDLEARVKNRQILLETYRGYLANAKDMKDILDVDDRINSLTHEIEQMKGSLLSLDRAIQYSTINLSIINSDVAAPPHYAFITRITDLGSGITDFFISALFTIIYVAVIGTTLILLAALVFYLTFGKLGLVKKLFKKLK